MAEEYVSQPGFLETPTFTLAGVLLFFLVVSILFEKVRWRCANVPACTSPAGHPGFALPHELVNASPSTPPLDACRAACRARTPSSAR